MGLASSTSRTVGFYGGLALFAVLAFSPPMGGLSPEAQAAAAVGALMALWWITEATHIAVTALIPLPLFPMLGIESAQDVAAHYSNHIVFLFFGGFIIALAMEKWDLHRRIALATIKKVGSRPAMMMLGFMIATAFLSMWISNTATTMMMLPIAMAVVNQLADLASVNGRKDKETSERVRIEFGVVLLLGIAYAASIGGVGTIIGSPTTVAFLGFLQETFPEEEPIGFLDYSLVCIPIVIVFIPITWLYLCRFGSEIPLSEIEFAGSSDVIDAEQRKLGPMSLQEKLVLMVSASTGFLWVTRRPMEIGDFTLPGWSMLFENSSWLQDSTVAMAMATLLFLIPSWSEKSRFLMDWDSVAKGIPWGIMFLFGGGFSLAAAMSDTGLASWIGQQMAGLSGAPIWVLIPMSCLLAVLLTETTSNIATVLMLAPVIAATALEIGVHPYLLLIPSAIMASFAFMLPVATPPNAIVFSSGWITIAKMFRAGVLLDMIALIIVPAMVYLLGALVFDFGG